VEMRGTIINNVGFYGDYIGANYPNTSYYYDSNTRGAAIENCANPVIFGCLHIGGLKSLIPGFAFDACNGAYMLGVAVWNCAQPSGFSSYGGITFNSCIGSLLYFSFISDSASGSTYGGVGLTTGGSLKICDTAFSRGSFGLSLADNSDITYVWGGTRNTTFLYNNTTISVGSNTRLSLDTFGVFNYLNYLYVLNGYNSTASLTSVLLGGVPNTTFSGITQNAVAWAGTNSFLRYT